MTRDHFRQQLTTVYKPILMNDGSNPRETGQLRFSKPYITRIIKAMHELDYQDEEIWDKVLGYLEEKKKLSTIMQFVTIWECLVDINTNPRHTKYGKLDNLLVILKKKHYK